MAKEIEVLESQPSEAENTTQEQSGKDVIQQLRNDKLAMEEQIKGIIVNFEDKYGVYVRYVEFDRDYKSNGIQQCNSYVSLTK